MVSRPRPGAGVPAARRQPPAAVRYPRLGAPSSRIQWISRFVALGAGIGLVYAYRGYLDSGDVSPDSVPGLAFAVAGTLLLLLVGVGYTFRKRIKKRAARRLHTALAWHATGGVLGLTLICMHTAGNVNARSGTYALYGLIALTVSGLVGRLLDRLCPRLAAAAAARAVTAEGEDRLVALEHKIAAAQSARESQREMLRRSGVAGVPWDLAYYDLDPEVESIPQLLRPPSSGGDSRGIRKTHERIWHSVGSHTLQLIHKPHALAGYVERQASAVHSAQSHEQFFIQLIRVWRRIHMLLSIVTLGLLIWHIAFAITLYLNTLSPR